MKSIPGWKMYIDEVSNGVFNVTLTDTDGRKAEVLDAATDETIQKAISYAFDIEKQISKNWKSFLYEFFIQELNTKLISTEYQNDVMGSWFIELESRRLFYDAKDECIQFQTRQLDKWVGIKMVTKEKVTHDAMLEFIDDII